MSGPTLLLVEDNPEDVLFLKRAFEKAGLACGLQVAEDGQQAIDQLSAGDAQSGPSHVILDLKLPRKSGLEVLSWIRGHAALRRLPVIVLSSSEVRSDIEQAYALGIDAYLVKPLTSKGLLDSVLVIAGRWSLPVAGAPSLK